MIDYCQWIYLVRRVQCRSAKEVVALQAQAEAASTDAQVAAAELQCAARELQQHLQERSRVAEQHSEARANVQRYHSSRSADGCFSHVEYQTPSFCFFLDPSSVHGPESS